MLLPHCSFERIMTCGVVLFALLLFYIIEVQGKNLFFFHSYCVVSFKELYTITNNKNAVFSNAFILVMMLIKFKMIQ